MKILMHMCCGPCAIYPLKVLMADGHDTMGFFYRHNIHPLQECLKRQEAVETYTQSVGVRVIYQKGYDVEGFLRNVVYRESKRCSYCYHDRLRSTALLAKRGKFEAFTSTLLYSQFQNHELIKATGEAVSKETGVRFYYRDFRDGWKEGVDTSKALKLYRQQYCGCIYSEKERFMPKNGLHLKTG